MEFDKIGSGPAVLLLHGLGASRFSWRNIVPALSDRFAVYAVDLPGFGSSPAPAGFDFSVAAQAAAAAAFIVNHALVKPVVIGHSLGGGVALRLAAEAGGAGWPQIGKLVLLAPLCAPRNLSSKVGKLAGKAKQMPPELLGPMLATLVLKLAYADYARVTPDQTAGYAQGLSSRSQIDAFFATVPHLAAENISAGELKKIANKTRIVWGEEDTFLPIGDGVALKASLAGSSLERIADCGHIPHEEWPDQTIGHIRSFLSK